MSKRKAQGPPLQNEVDETSFDEYTIGDAAAFLKDIDNDDFLGNLLSTNDGDHGRLQLTLEEGSVDVDGGNFGDVVLEGGLASTFGSGGSTRVFADGTPLVDPPEPDCESKPPAQPLYPPPGETNSRAYTKATRHQQLNAIVPRDIPGIGHEGVRYQPVEKIKRGPYRERRESWTTTKGYPSGRLSGTISTKDKSNPLPLFKERIVTVSVAVEETQDEEEQEL